MFTVQKIWSPFDPNLKHLDKTEPAHNGNNVRSLAVPLHAGFTVQQLLDGWKIRVEDAFPVSGIKKLYRCE